MNKTSRRDFLKQSGIVVAAGTLTSAPAVWSQQKNKNAAVPFGLGVASYSLRAFPLAEAVAITRRLGLKRITLKDMHLPLNSSEADVAAAHDILKAAGIELTSCGVVYMQTEEEVRRAFEYAGRAGLTMLVGAPDVSLLSVAEGYVKKTGIALAIHNHGPADKRFPSPESAYRAIVGLDGRMGLCLDIGHTQRLGLDPAQEAERFFDRLLDVHIKDVSASDVTGTTVEIGRGVIDIPGFLRTMIRLKYQRTLHLEYEKDEKDPLPGMAESVGYVHGVLAMM